MIAFCLPSLRIELNFFLNLSFLFILFNALTVTYKILNLLNSELHKRHKQNSPYYVIKSKECFTDYVVKVLTV